MHEYETSTRYFWIYFLYSLQRSFKNKHHTSLFSSCEVLIFMLRVTHCVDVIHQHNSLSMKYRRNNKRVCFRIIRKCWVIVFFGSWKCRYCWSNHLSQKKIIHRVYSVTLKCILKFHLGLPDWVLEQFIPLRSEEPRPFRNKILYPLETRPDMYWILFKT